MHARAWFTLSAARRATAVGLTGILGLLARSAAPLAQTAPSLPPNFENSIVLSGLTSPTAVRFSPDGRIFVAEKSGLLKVFDGLQDTSPTVFADLRTSVHNYWDRGLLGLAVDPDFPVRPYVYVLYTRDAAIGGMAPRWGQPGQTSDPCPGGTTTGCVVSGRLARLEAAGNVMTGAERVLLDGWFQQFPAHSVGGLAFGRDGALYVSGGEGATWQFVDYGQVGNPAGDPPTEVGVATTPPTAEGGSLRSQDLRTSGDPVGLSGAILRVDPSTGAALPDNPLYGHADPNARRIIAYGLRNPFRIATRPLASGADEVWIGDVGWRSWEEINRISDPKGPVKNFGWPCYEGAARQPAFEAAGLNICQQLYAAPGSVSTAHYAYQQGSPIVSGETCSVADSAVSGLAFYQDGNYPSEYRGALFFSDYSRRCIWVMLPGTDGVPSRARLRTFMSGGGSPVDLQIGPGGDLFYVDNIGGTIRRITFADRQPPVAVALAAPSSGPTPLPVTFDGSQSWDPDGTTTLLYDWDLDGNGVFGDSTAARPTRTFDRAGEYDVRLKVTDADGLSGVGTVRVTAGNTPPSIVIDRPAAALLWQVGQVIEFSARATDPEQGTLGPTAFSWSLIMHHCSLAGTCHEHGVQQFLGIDRGTVVAPDHEFPSHLELRATARDAGGLSATASVRLDPLPVDVTFDTVPAGLMLAFNSESFRAPAQRRAIAGSTGTISAPSPQTLNGVNYAFSGWSDGLPQTHMVRVGTTPVTYRATFGPVTVTADDIVMYAADAVPRGSWRRVPDGTAAGGARLDHPNANAAKLTAALAVPANYFDLTFTAQANRPYHLWLRGRAELNSWQNDSVYVQFSGSLDSSSGSAAYRIGTTGATAVSVEDCSGCGLSGWGWQDNAYGSVASPIYFAQTGRQTIRIQTREDGVSVDQIVLSPATYSSSAPGRARDDTRILARAGLPGEIVLHAAAAAPRGLWRAVPDGTAASGTRMEHPDAGAAKLTAPLAAPANYFDLTFRPEASRAYHLWIRGRAQGNAYTNDSVFVQFSHSINASNTAQYRIGSTDAAAVSLEDCSGCGLAGWIWQDNAYGALAGPVSFSTDQLQTIRIQTREDGVSLDQIVLSPGAYLTTAPGATRNDTTIMARTQ